jgi:hypothetical protein
MSTAQSYPRLLYLLQIGGKALSELVRSSSMTEETKWGIERTQFTSCWPGHATHTQTVQQCGCQ